MCSLRALEGGPCGSGCVALTDRHGHGAYLDMSSCAGGRLMCWLEDELEWMSLRVTKHWGGDEQLWF